jgi:hypothetical protein
MANKKKWDGVSTITIPANVSTCPECGAAVFVDIYEITQADNNEDWKLNEDGSGFHLQCVQEDDSHYQMPYVDWLPLEPRIIRWINDNYDFNPYPVTD